ncbi:type II toxin-antitoxin system RelE/ParE family toxin [Mesorhizobium sp. J428]|uniref:type II toxin-antitoxin system RelE/ParE family toxin n=1 Tax=Mesorhizobium sp. J428 TaxID=2898440 RepID=UPI002150FEB6|nr:type II toxin-antitoxin system RelE/ParE family toxin [Mesorhizobium sp. J428]MCR5856147.1 type II toxin-antitoxin system RelE/ParE family toxin [Mesorhizobium sp. J428]
MNNYILSPAAQADIDRIWDYTADNWGADRADRYVREIRRACASISVDGREGRKIFEIKANYRKLSVGSHFIIFRLVHGQVDVVRVLHQRMDIASHLED